MRKVLLFAAVVAACSGGVAPPPAVDVVTGSDGRALALDEPASRIVSLSATHTEMLYAISAESQIAGTDLTSDHPAEAQATTKVDAFNFNVEEVAALEPDLVVLAFDFQGEIEALDRVGIASLLLAPAVTVEEIYWQIEAIGAVTGRQSEAEALVARMGTELETIFESAPRFLEPPTVYHEVDATLFSPNSATLLGDVYRRFGVLNVADRVPDEFGSGYVQLSEELILSSDPDVIFLGDAAFGESAESLASRPGWNTLTAVKRGYVFALDADISGRWGPRTVELAAAIAAALEQVGG